MIGHSLRRRISGLIFSSNGAAPMKNVKRKPEIRQR